MDGIEIEKKAEQATSHLKDPMERARRKKNLIRAMMAIFVEPIERLAEDKGQFDGIPVASIDCQRQKQDYKLDELKKHPETLTAFPPDEEIREDTPKDTLNRRGCYGYTPLIEATVNRDYSLIRKLLELGADTTIRDQGRRTALEKAIDTNDQDAIALFQEFGFGPKNRLVSN